MKNYTWYLVRCLGSQGKPIKSQTCRSVADATALARKWDTGDNVLVIITPLFR